MKKSTLIAVAASAFFFIGFHLTGFAQSTICGSKTVGLGGDYTTLTAAISDLNTKDLCGALILSLTDATYPNETFPIIINHNLGSSSTNTITIKPAIGVSPVINCNTYKSVIVLNGSENVIIDGSNQIGGSSKDLTFINSYTGDITNCVISLEDNGTRCASNSTIKNCTLQGSQTVTNSFSIFFKDNIIGYFENTSIINNTIKNAKIGILIANANNSILENNIIGNETEPLKQGGIKMSKCANTVISKNDIFGEVAGNLTTYQYGIFIGTNSTNSKIIKNKIHDFIYTGTDGVACWGIYYNAEANTQTEISNNLIYNIKSDGDMVSVGNADWIPSGITVKSGGNIQIYFNSINMTGNGLGITWNSNFAGNSTCLLINSAISNLDIRNNILKNSMTTASGTGANKTFGIVSYSDNSVFSDINYNDYYINGLNPNVGYLSVDLPTISDWQTSTLKDANSLVSDPGFQSDSDLRPSLSGPNNTGIAIAGITTDYADAIRSNPPDIGAFEYLILPVVITDSASNINWSSAQLNGTVTANYASCDVYFEWGLTTAYGNSIAATPNNVNEGLATPVLANLIGLDANTTYHFRCVGTNLAGTAFGNDSTFTTACQPPEAAGLISGISPVCQGTMGVIYSVDPIADATNYAWTVPTGATIVSGSSTNSITVDYSASAESGIIVVHGVNSCSNGIPSSYNVTVYPMPPTPVITQSGNTITSDATTGNQWYLDGLIIPDAIAQTYEPIDNGNYTVIVTHNGCSSDTSNIITKVDAGITDNIGLQNISVYPNPNNGRFTLSITSTKHMVYDMKIVNTVGISVYERKAIIVDGTLNEIIELSDLPKGLYSIVLNTFNNQIIKKMVIN